MDEENNKNYKYYPNVVLLTKKLLMDQEYTDFTIKVGSESVQAHAGIVACRCESILPLTPDNPKKKKSEVKLKDGTVKSAAILRRVLEYIYTSGIEFPKLTIEEILYVNQAGRNLNLHRLVYICEKWIRESLSMEIIYHYLKAASDLKEESVKGICLNFVFEHYVDFISNKGGIQIIGIDLFQEVVAMYSPANIKSDENAITVPNDTLIKDFKKLYKTMAYSDSTITINDQKIPFHRYILIAHYEGFHHFNFDISEKAFSSMLKFMYYGDDKIDVFSACQLVDISRKYKLHTLSRIVEEIIKNNINHKSALHVLEVAYLPAEGKQEFENEIKSRALPYIIDNIQNIDLSYLNENNFPMSVDIVRQFQASSEKGSSKPSKRRTSIPSSRSSSNIEKESRDKLGIVLPSGNEKIETPSMPQSAKTLSGSGSKERRNKSSTHELKALSDIVEIHRTSSKKKEKKEEKKKK